MQHLMLVLIKQILLIINKQLQILYYKINSETNINNNTEVLNKIIESDASFNQTLLR